MRMTVIIRDLFGRVVENWVKGILEMSKMIKVLKNEWYILKMPNSLLELGIKMYGAMSI